LALKKWTRLILGDQDPEDLDEALEAIEEMAEPEEASTVEPASPEMPMNPEEMPMEESPTEVSDVIEDQ
jgi:hypothetical protein